MFTVIDLETGTRRTVYGVHRSGSHARDTKFLVYECGRWAWVLAGRFTPAAARQPARAPRSGWRILQTA